MEIEVRLNGKVEFFMGLNHALGIYVARPYNLYLSPLPDKKLNVERDFSYQSGGKTSHRVEDPLADLPQLWSSFLDMDSVWKPRIWRVYRTSQGKKRQSREPLRLPSGIGIGSRIFSSGMATPSR